MRKVVGYEASDGNYFKNYEDCMMHEWNLIEGSLDYQETDGEFVFEIVHFGHESKVMAVRLRNMDDLRALNRFISECNEAQEGREGQRFFYPSAIGTIQLIEFFDGNVYIDGDIEEFKKAMCARIDEMASQIDERYARG